MPTEPQHDWVTVRMVPALEAAMAHRDVNASELARLAGTSRQNISNILKRKSIRVRADIAGRIDDALDMGERWIFRPDEEPAADDGARAHQGWRPGPAVDDDQQGIAHDQLRDHALMCAAALNIDDFAVAQRHAAIVAELQDHLLRQIRTAGGQ